MDDQTQRIDISSLQINKELSLELRRIDSKTNAMDTVCGLVTARLTENNYGGCLERSQQVFLAGCDQTCQNSRRIGKLESSFTGTEVPMQSVVGSSPMSSA